MGCAFPMQNTEAPNVKFLKFFIFSFLQEQIAEGHGFNNK